jgi:hypothetical protein
VVIYYLQQNKQKISAGTQPKHPTRPEHPTRRKARKPQQKDTNRPTISWKASVHSAKSSKLELISRGAPDKQMEQKISHTKQTDFMPSTQHIQVA